ncbi:MAG TPA: penicillin-binding transpeptidase domain-containing protein [Streptosporangiaceae bacterium]
MRRRKARGEPDQPAEQQPEPGQQPAAGQRAGADQRPEVPGWPGALPRPEAGQDLGEARWAGPGPGQGVRQPEGQPRTPPQQYPEPQQHGWWQQDQRYGDPLDSGNGPAGTGQARSSPPAPPGGRPYLPAGPELGGRAYQDRAAPPQPFGSSGRYPSPPGQWPPGQADAEDPGAAAWPAGWTQAGGSPAQASGPAHGSGAAHAAGAPHASGPAIPVTGAAGPAGAGQEPPRKRGRRRRTFVVVSIVVVLIAAAAAAGGGYLLLRSKGSPQQTAAEFLRGWQRQNYRAMNQVSVGRPAGGVAGPITAADQQLGVRGRTLRLGAVTSNGGTALARFTVTDQLNGGHTWRYRGIVHLVNKNRRWWVRWSPSVIYPRLRAGERFTLSSAWPSRAPILTSDGTALSSPATLAQSGSLALIAGYVGPATKAQAKRLGAPYKAGDPVGQSGIEQTYQSRLAGSPSLTIHLTGPGKQDDGVVHKFAAIPGKPVRTSIRMSVQLAASQAVLAASTSKPIDMVVIQPSTGRVLAMVERPGSWDRALYGLYPPGSTFKIVTASALAKEGMTPSSPVDCPSKVDIGGYTIHNDQNEQLGSTTLLKAFAISCNTTFAELAAQRLTGAKLEAMAKLYGYDATPALGIPARLGSFQRPPDSTALAAQAFGQGTDLASPLSQASEAAATQSGTWRPPLLVVNPMPKQKAHPHTISPSIIATLRPMMHAVVTIGTAAGVGFPPGVYGKTGTAEYGTGKNLQSHGWFIGYDGDLAFAVLVEGGGFGATSAGPIANTFLRKVYGG